MQTTTTDGYKRGERKAHAVIFKRGRITKADVLEMARTLQPDEIEGAMRAFHVQGPRLWGFWYDAQRKIAGAK